MIIENDNIIKTLNKKQREFVLLNKGPCVVLAGAGSGKTKALTTKVYYLIKYKNINPYEILAITFTNKAASEMKERVEGYFKNEIPFLNIYTFHAFCARFLRREYKKDFIIFDDKDAKVVIKSILKDEKLDEKEFPPNSILNYIDHLKNLGYYIGKKSISEEEKELMKHGFYELYEDYQKRLEESNALDFGDLIVKTIEVLQKNNKLKEQYRNRYKYIMIDEYQDTNDAQYLLVKELHESNKNDLFVIGDEDQSIYSFRGANVYNILNFEKDFPITNKIKLEENYRSTNNILNVANNVIKKNEYRLGKKLFSSKSDGNKVNLHRCESDRIESKHTVNDILNKINEGIKPNQISIIYRNNSQSRLFEEELRSNNIPYRIFGGMKFYDRKEIKDLISYLRFLINKNDNFSLFRIINLPSRGVGKKTLDNIKEISNKKGISAFNVLKNRDVKLSKKASKNINNFLSIFEELSISSPLKNIVSIILERTGYMDMLKNSGTYEDEARIDNLKEFISSLYEYDKNNRSIHDLLEDIYLITNEDEINEEDCVNLMTVHSSKGLEFDVVYLVSLEKNIFPSSRSMEELDPVLGIEEERRLFYVAITRAKIILKISYCDKRFLYGNINYNSPSQFLEEIPKELYHFKHLKNLYK